MNTMVPIKIDEIETQAGTQLVFDRVDTTFSPVVVTAGW